MVHAPHTGKQSNASQRMPSPNFAWLTSLNAWKISAHYNLGGLLENKADYGGAEQHYRRARAIDPEEHADAHCELAGQPRPSWCL